MINITLTYQAANIEEFTSLVEKFGSKINPQVSKPEKPAQEKGPQESAYLKLVGQERMRLNREESQSGLSREEIAHNRIQALQVVPDAVENEAAPDSAMAGQDFDPDDLL